MAFFPWVDFMSSAEDYDSKMAAENRQLSVPVKTEDEKRMAVIESLAGLGGSTSVHNFVGEPVHIWRMITLGENKSEPGADLPAGTKIGIVNWYLHRIRIEDQATGEVAEPVRTVLYTDEGKIYHFVSEGIVKAVANIIRGFGLGPYNPPVQVEVLPIKTNSKRTMLTLIPAE